jgi:alpha-beta hydrolase superfamily lysophospholipase
MSDPDAETISFDLDIDVTDVAGLDEPATIGVSVHAPVEEPLLHTGIVCFAKPGAGFTRHYFTDDLPGPSSGAQAAWHAARGWTFVSCDHLGVGTSSRHATESLTFRTVAAAADAAERQVIERLADGTLADQLPPVRDPLVVGLGQSMGGSLLVVQQARHRTYNGIGVLGYSAIHTRPPLPPGAIEMVLPWMPRDARFDDQSAMLNPDRVITAAHVSMSDEEFISNIAWGFHFDDVDRRAASTGRWISDGYLHAIIAYVTTPGIIASEAAAIEVPVLVAVGERDTVADPRGEPRAYLSSRSVDLFICPRMAHMHNFAGTRHTFWRRIETWAAWVGAHRELDRAG